MNNNICSKGRIGRRVNESVYLKRTMVALEQIAGETQSPMLTLEPDVNLIES
jgi:hypothetical protein